MPAQSYLRKNISLAWPLAINGLLMQSMLMVDTLLVSPLGESSLAAMGIAGAILMFMLGVHNSLANGTQLILSRAVGSGNNDLLARGFWSGLIINFSVASIFWLSLVFGSDLVVLMLTDNLLLQQQTIKYLALSKYLTPFTAITQVIIALFYSRNKSKVPLKGYVIEMPVNATLSYFLIHGVGELPGMGVEGAALGSLLAIIIRAIYLITCLKLDNTLSLKCKMTFLQNIRLHGVEIFPFAANMILLQMGVNTYQLLFSQLSINAYAAIILVMPWIKGMSQFMVAWAHSSAISISQILGSKKLHDLSNNIKQSINIAMMMSVACAGVFVIFSLVLPSIYQNLEAETYLALNIIAPLYIFLPIVRGHNAVHGHILRALGKTTSVFKINFIGQWLISIPLCALLILYFEASIFWVFAIQPFEEIIKAFPFRQLAKKSVKALKTSNNL